MAETNEIVYLLVMHMITKYSAERFEAVEEDAKNMSLSWTLRSVFGTLAKATEVARSSDVFEKFHPDLGEFVISKEDTRLLESFWFKHAEELGVAGFLLRSFMADLSFGNDDASVTEYFAIFAVPTVVQR